MGVDWQRVRVRSGVDRTELRRLVREQAAMAWRVLYHIEPPRRQDWWVPGPTDALEPDEDTKQRYLRIWDTLLARLHVAEFFNAFGKNPLFPPEWHAAALRTWLPEELPAALQGWTDHLEAVREGRYRRYLFVRYLHDHSRTVREAWRQLVETAEATATQTNAWATKPAQVELRLELHRADADRVELTRALDATLPGNWKIRDYGRIPTFAEFLARADDPFHDGLFAWLERCCDQGEGLLLYG